MKIEIFNKKTEDEDVLRLNTEVDNNGNFIVFACDKNGDSTYFGGILVIKKNGQLKRIKYVKAKGIQTDDKGRILLDD